MKVKEEKIGLTASSELNEARAGTEKVGVSSFSAGTTDFSDYYLLQENGDYLLQENGGKLILDGYDTASDIPTASADLKSAKIGSPVIE